MCIRAFAAKTVPVPGMGDSISSGVIEEFVKGPGDFVEADEILARIETDKVTVDITAPEAGVIQKYFAAEGDEVNVGADFYILDTDASAPAGGAPAAAPKAAEPVAAAPTPATPAPAAPADHHARTPLIKFIGKRHRKNKHIGANDALPAASSVGAQQAQTPRSPSDAKALNPFCEIDFQDDHSEFEHRLPMTEEEIEIINQGGNDCYGWEKITL